jgi:hypothetical protein
MNADEHRWDGVKGGEISTPAVQRWDNAVYGLIREAEAEEMLIILERRES